MLKIPSLISTSADEFAAWSNDLAIRTANSAKEIRLIIENSNISNKSFFSISDDMVLIQYISLCLAYGQLEPGVYNHPEYKKSVAINVSEILKKINLETQGIAFVNQIEDKIISALESANAR